MKLTGRCIGNMTLVGNVIQQKTRGLNEHIHNHYFGEQANILIIPGVIEIFCKWSHPKRQGTPYLTKDGERT